MYDYEKLGAFYLGKEYDVAAAKVRDDLILYDSKDLTTHAVIVGMTGSGKTGLGISLLEEAAIDSIPAIIIDPKGDLGNLLLTFPQMEASDFRPWVEKDEAARKGMTQDEFAAKQAETWKQGLADWGQSPERIQRLRDAADVVVYTPGSDAGLPLTILKSLDAPPPSGSAGASPSHDDAMRERVAAAVAGLLTLLGIDADPLRSREHILLSNIVDAAWRAGRNLELGQLIREIQQPPFQQIGVMDLESIFPAKDRLALAMTINNVLASPGFAAWTRGEPLNIQRLLYSPSGKPRLCILSIAHLNDQERMFFVTILLNEFISWMRSQTGTSSLRAILYMDEVFGYLPPTANPPSKIPMLTLLKQARAFGVGLVLATQNPVDLDYKALSNAGTWFLGRLQTERDKLRVLDGLEGASTAAGAEFDRNRIEQILSGLGNRVFLMNNVHEDAPVVFQTRWALSYLRGPMTREQLGGLMGPMKESSRAGSVSARSNVSANASLNPQPSTFSPDTLPPAPEPTRHTATNHAPILPPEIKQVFAVARRSGGEIVYRPALLATGKLHFVDSKAGIDSWQEVARICPVGDEVATDPWDDSDATVLADLNLETTAIEGARFDPLASALAQAKSYKSWLTSFKSYLYRSGVLEVPYCAALKAHANPGESEGDFRARLKHEAHEKRDLDIEKLRKKYATKIATLEDKLRRAEQRVEAEKSQASNAAVAAAVSVGTTILGALFGRKMLSATNVGRAATGMRAAGRATEQRGDVARASENVEALSADLAAIEEELQQQVDELTEQLSVDNLEFETEELKPRKSDTTADGVQLLWVPYRVTSTGSELA